jgi:hypothetical protein
MPSDRAADDLSNAGDIGNVDRRGRGGATLAAQLLRNGICRASIAVEHDHDGAFARESSRRGGADARCAARHQRNFVGEPTGKYCVCARCRADRGTVELEYVLHALIDGHPSSRLQAVQMMRCARNSARRCVE